LSLHEFQIETFDLTLQEQQQQQWWHESSISKAKPSFILLAHNLICFWPFTQQHIKRRAFVIVQSFLSSLSFIDCAKSALLIDFSSNAHANRPTDRRVGVLGK